MRKALSLGLFLFIVSLFRPPSYALAGPCLHSINNEGQVYDCCNNQDAGSQTYSPSAGYCSKTCGGGVCYYDQGSGNWQPTSCNTQSCTPAASPAPTVTPTPVTVAPSVTPTGTITPTPFPTTVASPAPTVTPTPVTVAPSVTPTGTITPTPFPTTVYNPIISIPSNLPTSCYMKQFGDADCINGINEDDYKIWKASLSDKNVPIVYADFFPDGKISVVDFEIWRRYSNGAPIPVPSITPTPTAGPSPTPAPITWNFASNAVCANGYQPQLDTRTFTIIWPNPPTLPNWPQLFTTYDPSQSDPDNNPQWSNGTTHNQTIVSNSVDNHMYFGLQTNVKDSTNDFQAFRALSVSPSTSLIDLGTFFNPLTNMVRWNRDLPAGNYTVNFDIPSQFCNTGTIAGHVTIGPLCPGPATEPNTCAITPDFTNRHFYVFAQPDNTYVTRIDISPGGNYSVNLPPGNYLLNTSLVLPTPPARPSEHTDPAMPYPFIIVSGQTLTVNVDIDTGIR